MSDLRDARLQRALELAPDADLRPHPRVRRDILAKAHEAVAPAPAAPWWQRLWQDAGSRSGPWNAAFATIVLAGFITVLWYDREVPDARPEAVTASAPVQSPAAAPPASVAPAVPPTPQTPPVAAKALAPATAQQPRKSATAQPKPPAEVAQDAATAPAPAPDRMRDAPAARRADSAPVREESPRALAKGTAPQAEESRAAAGLAAAPAAMGPATAPPARMATQLRPSAIDGVTRLSGTTQGRAVDVALEQPSLLAELLARVIRDARSPEPLAAPVDTRIELRRQGELAGVLELAGSQARWNVWRNGVESGAATVWPDGAVLRALRDELGRAAR